MRRLPVLTIALASSLMTACMPAPQAFDPARQPTPADLGAQNSATEWWYVSGFLPESELAFHWAQFKVNYRGLPYHAGHLAIVDLNTGKLNLLENESQRASFGFPPLKVEQGSWALVQEADGGR